jgi:hypothetical protein
MKAAIEAWETLVKTNPDHPSVGQVNELLQQAKMHAKRG